MAQRRMVYLTVLTGAVVFYWVHRAWLSAVLLAAVAFLPLLSLILSLPAMIMGRLSLQCPACITVGNPARVSVELLCPLPAPALSGKLRLLFPATGKKTRIAPGALLPTAHCGAFRLQAQTLWVCDYLGLWRLPKKLGEDRLVLVRPRAVMPSQMPDMSRYLTSRPKPGGGYGENHELRLYRPGDNLRQIHWKLSAKAGKLILREPMEPSQDAALLTLELLGSPQELDRKLGQLLGVSLYLLEQGIRHRIGCYTGKGLELLPVSNEADAMAAIDLLLQQPLAEPMEEPVYPKAVWRYRIGGDGCGE